MRARNYKRAWSLQAFADAHRVAGIADASLLSPPVRRERAVFTIEIQISFFLPGPSSRYTAKPR